MAIIATFNQALKAAIETDRASAPSGNRQGRAWWEGGRWFDVITDGFPSVQDHEATIFPAGHAGDRRINQQQPVVGRKWTEGDFAAPVVADFLAPILYAAMGSLSSNMIPSSTASLLLNEPIAADPKVFVLLNQPTNGGAILRFDLKGGVNSGTISISGINSDGNAASELISFASAGTIYSRTSWSSVGASAGSGFAISGISAGSVTVIGIQAWQHTFTTASVAPTLSFERIGNPTAGESSANLAFRDVAMVLREFTLENDADAVDGLARMTASFEGDPTGSSAQTTLNGPSVLRVWPSWTLQVTRDGGTAWNVVKNISMNVTTNNRNYRAAANTQGPQGSFFGGQEFNGNISILLNNELEFQKWRGASQIRMHALWTSPWKLLGASNMSLSASLPAFLENVQVTDDNSAYTLSGDYRIVRDDNFPMSFRLTNGVPGGALGNTVL